MSRFFSQMLKATSGVLGILCLFAQGVIASPETVIEAVNPDVINSTEALGILRNRPKLENFVNRSTSKRKSGTSTFQVTNVSELRDISPTDWTYEALSSLVERYGCIVGYPDRAFRGDRSASRWEFAAGLNACLNTIERLLQENVAVLREDIENLKRLTHEFERELIALGAQVNKLERRMAFLENHQFSTTTKSKGEVLFTISSASGERALDAREQDEFNQDLQNGKFTDAQRRIDDNATFGYRARLNLNTSFNGKDRLTTRLEAGTLFNLSHATGTNMVRLGHDANSDADLQIDNLYYRFPIRNFTGYVGGNSLDVDDIFDEGNPFLKSSGTGALSRFVRRDPITMRGEEGIGAGFTYEFNDMFTVRGLYLTPDNDGANPELGSGLFNGNFTAGGQLGFYPTDNLAFNFHYLHTYYKEDHVNLTSSTGSGLASDPFLGTPTILDAYGANGNWRINDMFNLTGWVGYGLGRAQGLDKDGNSRRSFGADLWSWMAALNFVDIFKEGAVFSFAGGALTHTQRVDAITGDLQVPDQDTPYIIEAQYQYPLTTNILLTPGFYVILQPESNNDNNSIWVGALRTTFEF
ncbi:iron uptake porin [cyanobacterium endosymbiont of Epithemia clementina EcSB]|uniref:iron uptake porin n=1 Tax=cyanobacterium endosymbiont of Epithemia clementina EcSB TaxID=3034674 RepID=UPI002480947C|nr:iron uptake porin [cyanobacterium endosymbiont of Epithemia clementina EcSB]WGT68058.1 iron uptake porin [cyanobacterium endosymbiont of Epithemia clementina EcSB]